MKLFWQNAHSMTDIIWTLNCCLLLWNNSLSITALAPSCFRLVVIETMRLSLVKSRWKEPWVCFFTFSSFSSNFHLIEIDRISFFKTFISAFLWVLRLNFILYDILNNKQDRQLNCFICCLLSDAVASYCYFRTNRSQKYKKLKKKYSMWVKNSKWRLN